MRVYICHQKEIMSTNSQKMLAITEHLAEVKQGNIDPGNRELIAKLGLFLFLLKTNNFRSSFLLPKWA